MTLFPHPPRRRGRAGAAERAEWRWPPSWYLGLAAAVGVQRMRELGLSRRHERGLRGARAAARTYPLMVATHVALLVLPGVEAAARQRRPRLPGLWVGLVAASTALRWWSIRTLGPSWNVRGVVPDGLRPVARGPYRLVRHPNYLAVAVEFLALPLAAGAVWSAVGLSLVNALVLVDRIRAEERLLARVPGYEEAFEGRARLIPGIF
ncbi:MAG TPA: isoprenylcysteine carboxylmethyltransferase family protein [Candidatus Dormibacteraeota bacterium]|nr:isoprenylcysteine carboxylmethyltransferase family protein [Candidatus Dormibacteraeota bacterium]